MHREVELALSTHGYGDGLFIAAGAYGEVYSVMMASSRQRMAAKIMKVEHAQNEISAFQLLKIHDNVIARHEIIGITPQFIVVVMELCPRTLHQYIDESVHGTSGGICIDILCQLLHGLGYIHTNGVVHCDVKPSNILLSDQNCVKIADFSLAQMLTRDVTSGKFAPGKTPMRELVTLFWRPPELILGAETFDGKVDVWSAGTIAAELLTAQYAFQSSSEVGVLFKQFHKLGSPLADSPLCDLKYYSSRFPHFSPPMLPLGEERIKCELSNEHCSALLSCLVLAPCRRPSAREAYRAFISQIPTLDM